LLIIHHILTGQLSSPLLIHHILSGQLSSSSNHSSHSHWSAFSFPCIFLTFSLASFLLPLLIHHILPGQLSSSTAHSPHSHWPAFFFHCSFTTFSLVSFLLLLLIYNILIGQLSSTGAYHPFSLVSFLLPQLIILSHWHYFHYSGRILNFRWRGLFLCCSFCGILIGWLFYSAFEAAHISTLFLAFAVTACAVF
jgi:hypothetical protein